MNPWLLGGGLVLGVLFLREQTQTRTAEGTERAVAQAARTTLPGYAVPRTPPLRLTPITEKPGRTVLRVR